MTEMIERVAVEMRRNRFKRTRRTVFDETVPPTEAELDDARAAIEAIFAESRFTEFRGMTVIVNPEFPPCFWNGKELCEIGAAIASPDMEK